MVSGKKPKNHLLLWLAILAGVPLLLTGGLTNSGCNSPTIDDIIPFQEGDLIFQTSRMPWHQVMGAFSPYPVNHCGIILKENGQFFVLEAAQRVQKVPLEFWIHRGENSRFLIARFKGMNDSLRLRIHQAANLYLGKPYDFKLSWNEEALYNAELVRKIYQQALGIYLGPILRIQADQLDAAVLNDPETSGAAYSGRKTAHRVLEIATPVSLLEDRRLEIVFSNF